MTVDWSWPEYLQENKEKNQKVKVVILFPGIGGSSDRNYVK